MTELLACKLSDRVAGFGGVAGAYLYQGDSCQSQNSVPWIAFHGKDDPIVPYEGGSSGRRHADIQFPHIESWIANWADQNGCESNPSTVMITSEITQFTYTDCDQDVEVSLYRIEGAGHTWPGGGWLPSWITGPTNQDINATELMWTFFQNYSLEE
jgi:polyhydroxybutyrate depolymerase